MTNFLRDADEAEQNFEQLMLDVIHYGRATIDDGAGEQFVVITASTYAKMRQDLGLEADPAIEKPADLRMLDNVDRYVREEWQAPV